MKTEAIQFTAPGQLIHAEVELPPLGPEDVLIEAKACGICMREVHVYNGTIPRNFPDVMGHEPVGIVIETGAKITHVKPGDTVAALGDHCLAKHFIAQGQYVVKIPEQTRYEDMIAEPAMCAVNAIRGSGLEPGDSVVVMGCGYMGLLLVQGLSRTLNRKLVAVDLNPERLELARRFGADITLSAADPDLKEKILTACGGTGVDVVFEASGAEPAMHIATDVVRRGGTLCLFGHHSGPRTYSFDEWHYKGIRVLNTVPWMSKNLAREFRDGVNLLVKGVFQNAPLITHTFSFADAEEAMRITSSRPQDLIKAVIKMD